VSALTLLDSEPGAFALFAFDDVTIACWPKHATGETVGRVAMATASFVGAGRRFSNVHLVKHGAALPTAEARAGFVGMMDRYAGDLACVAVALLGSGFWASALQSAITGMRMVSPRTFSMRIVNSMDAIAEWLPPAHLEKTGTALHAVELRRAMLDAFSHALGDGEGDRTAAATFG